MILTDEEKRMRDGAEGAATAAAMDLLIRYGDALACDRLCDVRNVAGTMTQPSPVKERLVREGGWDKAFAVINLDCDTDIEVPAMRVPTCQLQHGFGADARGVVPYPAQRIALQQDAESFYGRRGVSILATCTPYQVGNIPVRGEHVAWMESSAVIYANSVLGARTNCEGTASSGAASLTGKIPCWGNHRDENRYGTHLIDVRTPVDSFLDWGMLGYFAGGVAGRSTRSSPAPSDGLISSTSSTSARPRPPPAASSCTTSPASPPRPRPWRPRSAAREHPSPSATARLSGAPCTRRSTPRETGPTWTSSCSAARTPRWTRSGGPPRPLEGRRLSPGTELWLMLPRALRDVADRSGYTDVIERAGGRLLGDSCPAMSRVAPEGTRVFATDSAKQAHYLPAILGIEAWFGTLEDCVDAAVTGRWRGRLA